MNTETRSPQTVDTARIAEQKSQRDSGLIDRQNVAIEIGDRGNDGERRDVAQRSNRKAFPHAAILA